MDEIKKTSLAHMNEIQMTCKEHCHTTDKNEWYGRLLLQCSHIPVKFALLVHYVFVYGMELWNITVRILAVMLLP